MDGGPESRRAWQLRLEGVAREIDASFAPEQAPSQVAELRARIVGVLGKTP
jgi:MoxR-like ATPase